MLYVYTAQYNYTGPNRLDVTVKGKHPFGKYFAPTWEMVIKSKKGIISKEEYTLAYLNLMEQSKNIYPHIWEKLLSMRKVVLVCFCKPYTFCHRVLLANMLEDLGAIYKGELIL